MYDCWGSPLTKEKRRNQQEEYRRFLQQQQRDKSPETPQGGSMSSFKAQRIEGVSLKYKKSNQTEVALGL
eukprot:1123522-Amphidinium_carterae.1